jgi:hypothetical protein
LILTNLLLLLLPEGIMDAFLRSHEPWRIAQNKQTRGRPVSSKLVIHILRIPSKPSSERPTKS